MTTEAKQNEPEYVPFGKEWQAEMMKLRKWQLVDLLRNVFTRKNCQCSDLVKHGETSVMCCNECGLPTEEFWTKQT